MGAPIHLIDWREAAACRDAVPQLFDYNGAARPTRAQTELAQQVISRYCARCPVTEDCYAEAVATNSTGVRGGHLLTREHGSITEYNNHKKRGEEACGPCLEAAAAYGQDRRVPISAEPTRTPPTLDELLACGYARPVA